MATLRTFVSIEFITDEDRVTTKKYRGGVQIVRDKEVVNTLYSPDYRKDQYAARADAHTLRTELENLNNEEVA